MDRNYYVYQHTRLDTNEVFYIGISKVKKYKRARDKYDRSDFWKRIVNKTKYKIDILYENLTLDEANEIEINLISHYGRRNLGLGNLVNLTDGSSGVRNQIVSNETRLKQSLANTKHKSRKVINIETGEIYESIKQCAEMNNISYKKLGRQMCGDIKNNTKFKPYDEL